jgi:hypothetical protein
MFISKQQKLQYASSKRDTTVVKTAGWLTAHFKTTGTLT